MILNGTVSNIKLTSTIVYTVKFLFMKSCISCIKYSSMKHFFNSNVHNEFQYKSHLKYEIILHIWKVFLVIVRVLYIRCSLYLFF